MSRPNGTYPYETLIRHTLEGLAISHATVTVVDGREFVGSPQPLTGEGLTEIDHPALTALAEAFAADAVAERDAAVAAAAVVTAERDAALTAKTTAEAERDALQDQLDAILNPPDGIYPYQFQRLLTDEQLVAIQLSTDATLIRMRTDVQTIVSPMPFGDGSNLRNGVMYLGYVLPELFSESEVARIINRQSPV